VFQELACDQLVQAINRLARAFKYFARRRHYRTVVHVSRRKEDAVEGLKLSLVSGQWREYYT
jgi:hypothetical protein